MTGGKQFGRNWEIGIRWLLTGATPFTPYNVQETVRIENWEVRGFGIPDYNLLYNQRLEVYHQLDLRIDKKYYFKKWSLDIYFDIQNLYNFETVQQDKIDVVKDNLAVPLEDPSNPGFYIPSFLENSDGTVLPTIGVIIEM